MAIHFGIAGDYNTGKSFSRTKIKKGEKVFVISPNSKSSHITSSDGKALDRLNFSTTNIKSLEDAMLKNNLSDKDAVFKNAYNKALKGEEIKFSGNYITTDMYNIETYLNIIDRFMPQITVVIISDFTHYLSKIISGQDFRNRNKGNEAFQRYTDLAGDTLQNIIISIDNLIRKDIVIIKEYHVEFDENKNEWALFVPGGKMLTNTFKLASYYDYLLFTHIEPNEEGIVSPDSYKFVTERWKNYPARFQQLFKSELITNDLQLVIDKLSEKNNIKFL